MTLLLNDHIHPKLFKNPISKKNMSNQTLYRTNHITEFINHQKALNNQLANAFEQSSLLIKGSKAEQHSYFEALLARTANQEALVHHFMDELRNQQTPIQKIIERLDNLERMNEGILENMGKEGLMNEAIMAQLSFQYQSSHAISKTLGDYEVMYQDLISQQKKQENLFDEISEKLKLQEAFHQTMMEQLDQQKALTQKINNKLDNLKDFITEKFSWFTNKIEANYTLTTNFVSKFLRKNSLIQRFPIKLDDTNAAKEEASAAKSENFILK